MQNNGHKMDYDRRRPGDPRPWTEAKDNNDGTTIELPHDGRTTIITTNTMSNDDCQKVHCRPFLIWWNHIIVLSGNAATDLAWQAGNPFSYEPKISGIISVICFK